MTDLNEVKEGPIVAVQYPSKPNFSVSAETSKELEAKYSHLKNLDIDDKKAYKELNAAISDVSKNRIQITKEEDAIKKPLNAFRKLVLDTGKSLRAAFEPLELSLRAEKCRIDGILADREAAKRKVWEDNLNDLKSISDLILVATMQDLNHLSDAVSLKEITEEKYGELLGEAETLKEILVERISSSIKYKKEQQKFEAEKAAFEKERAEMEAIRAEQARKEAIKAEQLMTEQNREIEPDPEPVHEIKMQNGSTLKFKDAPDPDDSVIKSVFDSATDASTKEFEAPNNLHELNIPLEVIGDGVDLNRFTLALSRANAMRVLTKSKEESDAVERVKATLVKAIGYLEQFNA